MKKIDLIDYEVSSDTDGGESTHGGNTGEHRKAAKKNRSKWLKWAVVWFVVILIVAAILS